MNLKSLLTAAGIGLLSSTIALADSGDVDPSVGFVSTKSRAEVIAELATARAAGQIHHGERAHEPVFVAASTKTRAQVRAEMQEARRLGLMSVRGDTELQAPTAQQVEQIRQAGLRAVQAELLANR